MKLYLLYLLFILSTFILLGFSKQNPHSARLKKLNKKYHQAQLNNKKSFDYQDSQIQQLLAELNLDDKNENVQNPQKKQLPTEQQQNQSAQKQDLVSKAQQNNQDQKASQKKIAFYNDLIQSKLNKLQETAKQKLGGKQLRNLRNNTQQLKKAINLHTAEISVNVKENVNILKQLELDILNIKRELYELEKSDTIVYSVSRTIDDLSIFQKQILSTYKIIKVFNTIEKSEYWESYTQIVENVPILVQKYFYYNTQLYVYNAPVTTYFTTTSYTNFYYDFYSVPYYNILYDVYWINPSYTSVIYQPIVEKQEQNVKNVDNAINVTINNINKGNQTINSNKQFDTMIKESLNKINKTTAQTNQIVQQIKQQLDNKGNVKQSLNSNVNSNIQQNTENSLQNSKNDDKNNKLALQSQSDNHNQKKLDQDIAKYQQDLEGNLKSSHNKFNLDDEEEVLAHKKQNLTSLEKQDKLIKKQNFDNSDIQKLNPGQQKNLTQDQKLNLVDQNKKEDIKQLRSENLNLLDNILQKDNNQQQSDKPKLNQDIQKTQDSANNLLKNKNLTQDLQNSKSESNLKKHKKKQEKFDEKKIQLQNKTLNKTNRTSLEDELKKKQFMQSRGIINQQSQGNKINPIQVFGTGTTNAIQGPLTSSYTYKIGRMRNQQLKKKKQTIKKILSRLSYKKLKELQKLLKKKVLIKKQSAIVRNKGDNKF